MRTTYLFPGQGSQTKGMGKRLFARFPEETEIASDILGYSIARLCTEDPDGRLDQTQFTQPVLFVVNALDYKLRLAESGKPPDFLAGHSLGEYNALYSSGAFSFEDGIRLVVMRGKLMSRTPNGAMAAIIGPSAHDIRAALDLHELSAVYIANYNSPNQTVVAGHVADIERSRQVLEQEGAVFIRLKTSGAFHCPYMTQAKEEFARYLENFSFSSLTIPVVSNVSAQPYLQREIALRLADQIVGPVRWYESIIYLLQQGEMQFEELGVGNVLTKLMPSIRRGYQAPREDSLTDAVSESDRRTHQPSANQSITRDARADAEVSSQFGSQFTVDKEALAADARRKVVQWNSSYPVGTKVHVPGYESVLTTSTPAIIVFKHRAAVYMESYSGYFALDELSTRAEAKGTYKLRHRPHI
jgi:malonyl CoA-acyl carrier protein transacylase